MSRMSSHTSSDILKLVNEVNELREELGLPVKRHIFHGGCHGCTVQFREGVEVCPRCQYFDADWDLPNLFSDKKEEDVVRFLRIGIEEKRLTNLPKKL
jgi:hypothetical protein